MADQTAHTHMQAWRHMLMCLYTFEDAEHQKKKKISKLPSDPTESIMLHRVVFCKKTEGLKSMVRPPYSRHCREQSPLIRVLGEEKVPLSGQLHISKQAATSRGRFFWSWAFWNVSHFCKHTIVLIKKQVGKGYASQKYFSSFRGIIWGQT